MSNFFKDGISFMFRMSLVLLKSTEQLLLKELLNISTAQSVIRLLGAEKHRLVTLKTISDALQLLKTDKLILDRILKDININNERHMAFEKNLKNTLISANYRELLMP